MNNMKPTDGISYRNTYICIFTLLFCQTNFLNKRMWSVFLQLLIYKIIGDIIISSRWDFLVFHSDIFGVVFAFGVSCVPAMSTQPPSWTQKKKIHSNKSVCGRHVPSWWIGVRHTNMPEDNGIHGLRTSSLVLWRLAISKFIVWIKSPYLSE